MSAEPSERQIAAIFAKLDLPWEYDRAQIIRTIITTIGAENAERAASTMIVVNARSWHRFRMLCVAAWQIAGEPRT